MINDESPQPSGLPETPAERLLAMAENTPEVRARLIERWSRAEAWTCVEGVALAWTLDPTRLGKSELLRQRPETALPEEARHYLELAYRSSELSRGRITPSRFIGWAEEVGLAFHPDWRRALAQAGPELQRAPTSDADRRREALVALWARSPYWSPAEGVALAYDLDPKVAVARLSTGYDNPGISGPAEARHLLDLAYRALHVGDLDDVAAPVAFMRWARSIGVEFHPAWWDAMAGREVPGQKAVDEPAALPAGPDLKTKEQETLLKLVAGMAMAFYGWSPDALRSSATKEIADDLARCGVPLDPDTIRKWVRKGRGPDIALVALAEWRR
jgi:hypothetical protein